MVERQELLAVQEELRELDEEDEGKFDEIEEDYYTVSDFLGVLCEAYAQYLCKSYGIA